MCSMAFRTALNGLSVKARSLGLPFEIAGVVRPIAWTLLGNAFDLLSIVSLPIIEVDQEREIDSKRPRPV